MAFLVILGSNYLGTYGQMGRPSAKGEHEVKSQLTRFSKINNSWFRGKKGDPKVNAQLVII
ncbi:hypothetical protein ACJX0J_006162, partial [Zea mays]